MCSNFSNYNKFEFTSQLCHKTTQVLRLKNTFPLDTILKYLLEHFHITLSNESTRFSNGNVEPIAEG